MWAGPHIQPGGKSGKKKGTKNVFSLCKKMNCGGAANFNERDPFGGKTRRSQVGGSRLPPLPTLLMSLSRLVTSQVGVAR